MEKDIDVYIIINVLKRRFLLIIAVVTSFVVITGLYSSYILSPVYETKSVILVTSFTQNLESNNQKADFNFILQAVPQFPVLTMNSYILQAKSEVLMERTIKKLKLEEKGYTSQIIRSQIRVTNPKESNLLEITVRNNSPALAADIANAFCQEFMILMGEKRLQFVNSAILSMVGEVDRLNEQLLLATTDYDKNLLMQMVSSLENKIIQTKIARSINIGHTQFLVFSEATSPERPVGPNLFKNMLIAFALGLMLSLLLVSILEVLNLSKSAKESDSNQAMISKSM
ncbi:YveK family protein [Desulforamulus aquiferis]|uniref:Wzz/FepE/Etk N-terminal domain-containing protein n=1 Tax=Desulforamulus aquiferis TaxID=1397668 RepID=A0AAW7ZF62_9FIRM|nr:Wzz/FepE/Etk N-terminal domain-containing protein [Desulforamulus aquiferis]MDO7788434.1 Wzz/FepE/Etk N-terminal domain-containing protein [Desulforamulus aquiferis]RYD05697.1 hypothetical protein N752_07310 [Desulforamulus aquiferis]